MKVIPTYVRGCPCGVRHFRMRAHTKHDSGITVSVLAKRALATCSTPRYPSYLSANEATSTSATRSTLSRMPSTSTHLPGSEVVHHARCTISASPGLVFQARESQARIGGSFTCANARNRTTRTEKRPGISNQRAVFEVDGSVKSRRCCVYPELDVHSFLMAHRVVQVVSHGESKKVYNHWLSLGKMSC